MKLKSIKDVFIHPEALVESKDIGKKTRVWAFAHVLKGAKIGENCNICDNVFVESNVVIKNNVTVKCGVYLWSGVTLENNSFVGPCVAFTNDIRPRSKVYLKEVRTLVGEGASLGANATIICGVKIGKWSLIGAGSVVTKDVPDYSLFYGNPARFKGYVCQCSADLKFKNNKAQCTCKARYELKKDHVIRIA